MRATKWDGVGPKRDCLIRVVWNTDGDAEWIHFEYQEEDCDDAIDGNPHPERYWNDPSTIGLHWNGDYYTDGTAFEPDFLAIPTHWAELPIIEDI